MKLAILGALAGGLLVLAAFPAIEEWVAPPPETMVAHVSSPFLYTFNVDGVLEETATPSASKSPYFWLDSGGRLTILNGIGATILGALPSGDYWHRSYARNNPLDTEGGAYPQNVFRMVTHTQWDNAALEAEFFVVEDHFTESPNRNASNGLLLMSRYKDADTLYYAGVRVDGTAVIKKKYQGVYYTMAQKPLFSGTYRGEQDSHNLIPHHAWLGLRSESITNEDGSVLVRLLVRREGEEVWTTALEAHDNGRTYASTPPITGPGRMGIRTDFMDVQFRALKIETL